MDDCDAISETLTNEILLSKAIPLNNYFPLDNDVNFSTLGNGQKLDLF